MLAKDLPRHTFALRTKIKNNHKSNVGASTPFYFSEVIKETKQLNKRTTYLLNGLLN